MENEINWKAKFDELQAQAQRMADALEWIKTYGPADDLTVKFVNKALQQFKDGKGKGKEAQPESPGCPFCGIEGCQSDHK